MAIHAAMVDRMDQEIGRVVDQIREMKALDHTLIVFLSDNGADATVMIRGDRHDRAAEPGSAATFLCLGPGWAGASNAPFRLHKIWTHEGGISTPLIVHWPRGIAARGELRRDVGHVIDLVPTILELAGGQRPDDARQPGAPPMPGQSLVPSLMQDRGTTRELYFQHEGNRGLRAGNWKLVSAREHGGTWELYDLARDRGEQNDLAAQQPERVKEMAERWQTWDRQFQSDAARTPARKEKETPQSKKILVPKNDSASAVHPNVVLIVSDDQGWTDYGFMKHPHIKTPRLDELAARSALFPHAYTAAPLCRPSLASLLTGLYPHQHGICCNDPQGTEVSRGLVPGDFQQMKKLPALPRLLRQQGYRSFQTGKYWEQHHSTAGFTDGMSQGQRHGDKGLAIGRDSMQPIFDFIDDCQNQRQPFFVWYAPMMPHTPHTPPLRILQKYRDQGLAAADAKYYAMCEWFDETCGQLLDFLDARRLRANTLVMYVVDNGWSQGYLASQTGGGNGIHAKGKGSPYDGGVRTPLMISWPGHTAAGRYDDLVSNVDVAPTVLAACGVPAHPQSQGRSLLEVASGKERLERTALFGETFVHTAIDMERPAANLLARWVRTGDWKLIHFRSPHGKSRTELFQVATDPFEKVEVASKHPERVQELMRALDAWWTP